MQWPRALQFLVAMGSLSLISTVAMARLAPASLEARVKKGATKDQPRADRLATFFLAIFHIAWFFLIPNDVFRWRLLPKPSVGVSVVGASLSLLVWDLADGGVAKRLCDAHRRGSIRA